MKIGIIGLGYVGLTLGIAAAMAGIEVEGAEIDEHIKLCLNKNKAHFYEPGIDRLIARYKDKNFHVIDSFSDLEKTGRSIPDAFVVTVGTPLKKGSVEPDFDYIRTALKSIKNVYDGTQLIILRSTVSVGTTRTIVLPYLSKLCNKPEEELLVGMCPERTIEGNAIEELTHLPQIISGSNAKSIELAQELFRRITPCVVTANSLEEAELIKLYCNTYRDMNFAIGNAFCMAAQEFGVDGMNVIKNANYEYNRSNIAFPGFVAGPCLQKDAYILINNMPECASKDFIFSGRKYNESMEDMVVTWVKKYVGEPDICRRITLSGMTFKGRPETSDLRGSSSVYIAKKLLKSGYELNIHDYVADPDEMRALDIGDYYENIYDACTNSSALLVLNNHKNYNILQDNPVFHREDVIFKILDAWNVCTELYFSDNLYIKTLGNMFVE